MRSKPETGFVIRLLGKFSNPRYIHELQVYAARIQTQIQYSFKKDYYVKYTEYSKKEILNNVVLNSMLPFATYRNICRNLFFMNYRQKKKTNFCCWNTE